MKKKTKKPGAPKLVKKWRVPREILEDILLELRKQNHFLRRGRDLDRQRNARMERKSNKDSAEWRRANRAYIRALKRKTRK